jgi:hypothetical protein
MDLSTVARVKTLLGIGVSTYDTELGQILTMVSAQAEAYMDRDVDSSGTKTQYLDTMDTGTRTVYQLQAFPVSSITTIHYDPDLDYGAATLLSSDDYRVVRNGDVGQFMLLISIAPWPSSLKVVYVGGMASTPDNFVTSFPDIAGAVDAQVAFLFQRRKEFGLEGVSGAGGSVSMFSPVTFLPMLRQVLAKYRRFTG